jgi:hypothetical protein
MWDKLQYTMETRIQHISNQSIRNCNQFKSVSQTSLGGGDTSMDSLSSFPWIEKFIDSIVQSPEYIADPTDNPWHFI